MIFSMDIQLLETPLGETPHRIRCVQTAIEPTSRFEHCNPAKPLLKHKLHWNKPNSLEGIETCQGPVRLFKPTLLE